LGKKQKLEVHEKNKSFFQGLGSAVADKKTCPTEQAGIKNG